MCDGVPIKLCFILFRSCVPFGYPVNLGHSARRRSPQQIHCVSLILSLPIFHCPKQSLILKKIERERIALWLAMIFFNAEGQSSSIRAGNVILKVFGITRPGIKPAISSTQSERSKHCVVKPALKSRARLSSTQLAAFFIIYSGPQ